MRKKVQIFNKSVEAAGFQKDYKASIAEYIWNSFDANATEVLISSRNNEMGGLEYLEISDNGSGIDFENLDKTFGAFLYSEKSNLIMWSNVHGNKGKGRYSFISFANFAEWETIYSKNNKYYKFSININASDKDYYDISDEKTELFEKEVCTGTKVSFEGFHDISNDAINSEELRNYLLNAFAWFLYLNKDKHYSIKIDKVELHYSSFIDTKLSDNIKLDIGGNSFDVHFIKWIDEIKEKYYFYFLNDKQAQVYKKHTSYNNNAISFYHSVYIISSYFCDFQIVNEFDENQLAINEIRCQKDSIFKELIKQLGKLIERKMKAFIKTECPKLIEALETEGAFPKFLDTRYDQERKKDLVNVVQEIYCIQPKIFYKLNPEQKKSIIGFLNLLLSTDERENIITIIDNITKLSKEERDSLSNVLKKTGLAQIVHTIKMIENRYKIITLLKKLVFDLEKFTTERHHIQAAIEENYWIFGEQYHLVSADENFEKAIKEYLFIVDNKGNEKNKYKIVNQDRLRRPDIFMCRKRTIEAPNNTQMEENVIVELKEPRVKLKKEVYRQIEDYMDLISHEPKFNSQLRKWKFIIISSQVDDFIKDLYKSCEDKGRLFLVRSSERFEIYAMTWDDVFKSFEIRHRYIYEKLNFDKSAIEEELKIKGIEFNRESSTEITEKIIGLAVN